MSFFRSVTPVSKSPFECTTTATARRGAFVRGTGNSAVFRLRSSRIGRNNRARAASSPSRRLHLPIRVYICIYARVYILTAQKGSLSSHLWPRPSSFPAFDTPFRVAGCARPEKIYRHAWTTSRSPNAGKRDSGGDISRVHIGDSEESSVVFYKKKEGKKLG